MFSFTDVLQRNLIHTLAACYIRCKRYTLRRPREVY